MLAFLYMEKLQQVLLNINNAILVKANRIIQKNHGMQRDLQ